MTFAYDDETGMPIMTYPGELNDAEAAWFNEWIDNAGFTIRSEQMEEDAGGWERSNTNSPSISAMDMELQPNGRIQEDLDAGAISV